MKVINPRDPEPTALNHDDIYQYVRICEICQDMPEYSRIFQDMSGYFRYVRIC